MRKLHGKMPINLCPTYAMTTRDTYPSMSNTTATGKWRACEEILSSGQETETEQVKTDHVTHDLKLACTFIESSNLLCALSRRLCGDADAVGHLRRRSQRWLVWAFSCKLSCASCSHVGDFVRQVSLLPALKSRRANKKFGSETFCSLHLFFVLITCVVVAGLQVMERNERKGSSEKSLSLRASTACWGFIGAERAERKTGWLCQNGRNILSEIVPERRFFRGAEFCAKNLDLLFTAPKKSHKFPRLLSPTNPTPVFPPFFLVFPSCSPWFVLPRTVPLLHG